MCKGSRRQLASAAYGNLCRAIVLLRSPTALWVPEVMKVSVYGIERASYYTNIGQKFDLKISAILALIVREHQYAHTIQ